MNNKKIVLVVNVAWSMFNFRHGLLSKLISDGYEVTVITAPDYFSDKLRAMGCTVIDLPISGKGTNPLQDLHLLYSLYRLYLSTKPNFIIHYSIKPNIYGSLAAKLAGIPSLAVTTGLGYTFVNDNWIAKVARSLYKLAFRYPNEVWFLNEDDRQVFLRNDLVVSNKAVLLHGEGVNLTHFKPEAKHQTDGCFRFLLIARMLWDKGVGEYVEAAKIIREEYPLVKFQLLGDCGFANPSMIERSQVAEWEAEGIIEYLGSTGDVRPMIAQADCVVLPSYREGIPRTIIESAAMAKPVIVTDVPGCRDVVIPDETGLLCPVKDANALAICCKKMLGLSSSAREEMGLHGREFMMRQFDEKLVIAQYLHTFKKYGV